MFRRWLALATTVAVAAVGLASCGSSGPSQTQQFSPHRDAGLEKLSSMEKNTYLSGPLLSAGGPFLTDRFGRTVVLHGVNAVYKLAPYSLTVEPGKPNSLDAADAARISQDGFNIVRVGIVWAGIEPGTGGPNQAKVCTPGPYKDPGMWNQAAADAYIKQVAAVVNELGRFHIYSLIDMHQDVWSSVFSGEGAPPWAVCTSGHPVVIYPGRWSNNYANPAVDASFLNFFNNAVQGGLQNEYQRSWIAVARAFQSNPWVAGYDPINEPLGLQSREGRGGRHYSVGLSCIYGGSDGETLEIGSNHTLRCPSTVPKQGLIETLLETDTHHLIFPEIDNATDNGRTLFVTKATDLTRVVYNFHDYCPERSGVTGNPTNLQICSDKELLTMAKQEQLRPLYDTPSQPGGPAIMMTEFGATSDPALASLLVSDASTLGLSWIWWSWRYYNDPTGSSAEAVIDSKSRYSPVISSLTETHVVAVAGDLLSAQSSQLVGSLTLVYSPTGTIHAPTTIFISPHSYPVGYCVYAQGAAITSKPGAQYLTLDNTTTDGTIVVRVEPGSCVPSL